ncbi:thioredoxin family protein [Mediterraneibacter sp. ICN-202921]|uniref:thioredoxin family protein n=1 Tax=Mediterraneibacter sp. ICN-202921 TaxID=3134657 RepID=UPI0030C213A2
MKLFGKKKATRTALSELQLDYDIEHITDFSEIAGYGVMSTPALVFNGKVISYGKVLTVEEVKALLIK